MDSALFTSVDEGLSFAESRAMERAHMRNLNIQRKLDLTISSIHSGCEAQTSRISVEQRHLKSLLREMKEDNGHMILPRGLSERHVQMLKDARREAIVKSISLGEFDKKMSTFKDKRGLFRNRWQMYKSDASGRSRSGTSVEEICVDTNVHFNPYRQADEDKSLIRQLKLLNIDTHSLVPARFYCNESDEEVPDDSLAVPLPNPNDLQRHHTMYEGVKGGGHASEPLFDGETSEETKPANDGQSALHSASETDVHGSARQNMSVPKSLTRRVTLT